MSILGDLANLFRPVSDVIDNLHTSEEEKGKIRVKLAEIEAKVSTKMMDLQMKSLDANSKIAMAEQEHGNAYVKCIRPTISLGCFIILLATGFEFIEYKELIVKICGGYLGFYGALRTYEKKK
jgi:hypothetical protein